MADLGLQTQAERHFDFLVSERGYKCTVATSCRVRFESSTTFIELAFDGNRSFELGLLIKLASSKNPPFTIDEILRLRHAPEAESFSLVQVTTSEALATWVEKLAQMFRIYGDDFVTGNERSFAKLAEQRQREAEHYTLERVLRTARVEAEIAWRSKDYESVIKALKPVRTALTATEVGKLEFAEGHFLEGTPDP